MSPNTEALRHKLPRQRATLLVHHGHHKAAKEGSKLDLTSRTGVRYTLKTSGALMRHDPIKPWANKSERKQVLRARREARRA